MKIANWKTNQFSRNGSLRNSEKNCSEETFVNSKQKDSKYLYCKERARFIQVQGNESERRIFG
jgi:hypothetical protein